MTRSHAYPSPQAFRQALTAKLREASANGPWTLAQLQRQFAYDRLLERLYLVDKAWVVKGATALLARGIGVRGTIDVDIYRGRTQELAEADLAGLRFAARRLRRQVSIAVRRPRRGAPVASGMLPWCSSAWPWSEPLWRGEEAVERSV